VPNPNYEVRLTDLGPCEPSEGCSGILSVQIPLDTAYDSKPIVLASVVDDHGGTEGGGSKPTDTFAATVSNVSGQAFEVRHRAGG
jgi:hypothetical protein